MKFKELRRYISRIDRVHMLMNETLEYKNYRFISEVPESYDDYYVYGIGMRETEFPIKYAIDAAIAQGLDIDKVDREKTIYANALEIMLSETERDFEAEEEQ